MSTTSNTTVLGWWIAGLLALGLVTWGGIYVNGFFNAAREGQRTKVFVEGQAYIDGMKSELSDLFLQYNAADATGRLGIAAVTRDKFASVNTINYPAHLQGFLVTVGAR